MAYENNPILLSIIIFIITRVIIHNKTQNETKYQGTIQKFQNLILLFSLITVHMKHYINEASKLTSLIQYMSNEQPREYQGHHKITNE